MRHRPDPPHCAGRPSIAIIGPGAVGRTLGRLLRDAGYLIAAVAGRRRDRARAGARWIGAPCVLDPVEASRRARWVLLTVPDDAIDDVVRHLASAGGFRPGQCVFHTSGLHTSSLLAPARRAGASVASIHPLHSFARPAASLRAFRGTRCAVEGDAPAVVAARRLVRALGGRVLSIDPTWKGLYHAGAVLACNDLVALFGAGMRLLRAAGIGRRDAEAALLGLVEGTVRNLRRVGYPRALTGPVARGDFGTVQAHLQALARGAPGMLPAYRVLGALAVRTAVEKGTLARLRAGRLRAALRSPAGQNGSERVGTRDRRQPGRTSKRS
jgi:predicted short-subunit dehydrogenase-like oxidoreductase (DUF2520 family)